MNRADPQHPQRATLAAFADGRLSGDDSRRIETHVAKCETCKEILLEFSGNESRHFEGTPGKSMLGETAIMPLSPSEDPPDESTADLPPELVDHPRYEIEKPLGAGGMGVVYQARHRLMERTVAIKIINAKWVSNADAVERFRREVKAAARLAHRNIVTAYDAEQEGNVHFLVMEFVDGMSLAEVVAKRGRLPVLPACNYAMQAAQGLKHAQQQGMVHRDIKPQNLMRTPQGLVKILDFGLARLASTTHADDQASSLTSVGMAVGTPDFMAPEQARDSRRADIRADIYSLGCTLYYLLTAQVPFPAETSVEKLFAHLHHRPQPVSELRDDVPPAVAAIVEQMMAKDPAARFQTPAEVVDALKPHGKPGAATIGQQRGETDLPPLDAFDFGDLPAAEQQAPVIDPVPKVTAQRQSRGDWRKQLAKYRIPLLASAGIVALLLVAMLLAPVVQRFVAGGGSDDSADDSGADGGPEVAAWIDLIADVDPQRDAVAGDYWQKRDSQLFVVAADSARIALSYSPPREYDFEVSFTRTSGEASIALIFVAGTGQAIFDIDAWNQHLAGIQNIDGQDMQTNATRVDNVQLANDRRYTALVSVRRDRVESYLNGRLLTTYRGDGSNLSVNQFWDLSNSRSLGIGAYRSATTFHTVRVRPVTDG